MKRTRIPPEDPKDVKARDQAYIEKWPMQNWAKTSLKKGRRLVPRDDYDPTGADNQ